MNGRGEENLVHGGRKAYAFAQFSHHGVGQAPRTRTLATNAHTGELSRKTIVST
jgi:hypothetical protein